MLHASLVALLPQKLPEIAESIFRAFVQELDRLAWTNHCRVTCLVQYVWCITAL